jgi:beta-galactosidase
VWRNTTGVPAALRIAIKDGVGGHGLVATCRDAALVSVEVVDSAGHVVPTAADIVTFAVSGPASLLGTGNGDPACHTGDKATTRPAFHGKVLAVIAGGNVAGSVLVTASAPGFAPVSLQIAQQLPAPGFAAEWCHLGPAL